MTRPRSAKRRLFNALVPMAILAVAGGLSLNTGSATASDGHGESKDAHAETKAIEQPRPANMEGSGAGNVYSQNSIAAVPDGPDAGRELYVRGCSSCHGVNGEGRDLEGKVTAPSLINKGAAAVDFYVGTGRMPLDAPVKQAPRRDPVYTDAQVKEIAEYVESAFGEGVPIPTVNPDRGDLVEGNLLYSNNCAACHHSSGSGGAVGREYYAPSLYAASPIEVAEAIRVGPGAMPIFGHGSLNDQQVDSIVRYVEHLKTADKPGGFDSGSLGPFSEGFIGWIVGLGALLGITRWIGTRE